MAKRLSRIVGLPVVDLETGDKIALVKEALISKDIHNLLGLTVDLRKWYATYRYISFEKIFSLGDASITIKEQSVLDDNPSNPDMQSFKELLSTVIKSGDGTVIGSLSDLFIDINTGRVMELEVSEGVIQDILNGRKRMIYPEILSVNGSIIIARRSSDDINKTVDGQ